VHTSKPRSKSLLSALFLTHSVHPSIHPSVHLPIYLFSHTIVDSAASGITNTPSTWFEYISSDLWSTDKGVTSFLTSDGKVPPRSDKEAAGVAAREQKRVAAVAVKAAQAAAAATTMVGAASGEGGGVRTHLSSTQAAEAGARADVGSRAVAAVAAADAGAADANADATATAAVAAAAVPIAALDSDIRL
jgi:hypothetical protein